MTVLLVDDDSNCIELWTRMLAGLGDRIIFALTVEEALLKMEEIPPPDLVLLDLKIPPYSAPQTLAAVDAFRQFNPNLAVVAISGMRLDEILVAIKAAGVVVQAAITKEDATSQVKLLNTVRAAMVPGGDFLDTMRMLETLNGTVLDAEKGKRTTPLSRDREYALNKTLCAPDSGL